LQYRLANDTKQNQHVVLVVVRPIPLDDVTGVVLPAGRYPGKRIRVETSGSLNADWTNSEYKLELGGEQLRRMTRISNPNILQVEYDVTAHVRGGQIRVE
jgi:hypothetical protein